MPLARKIASSAPSSSAYFFASCDLVGVVAVAAVEDVLVAADGVHEGAALLQGRRDRRPVRPPVGNAVDGGGGGAERGADSCRSGAGGTGPRRLGTRRWNASASSASSARAAGHPSAAASSTASSAPRSHTQPKAARASAVTQPSRRGSGCSPSAHRGHGEPVVGEHVLDRLVLVLAQPAAAPRTGRRAPRRRAAAWRRPRRRS